MMSTVYALTNGGEHALTLSGRIGYYKGNNEVIL